MVDATKAEILKRMANPQSALSVPRFTNLFLYGDHGAWKTVTACQIGAHRGRVLLATHDQDNDSLHNHPEIAERVDVIPMTEGVAQIDYLADMLLEKEKYFPDYDTLVWDTVGSWVKEFLSDLRLKVKYGEKSRTSIEPRPGQDAVAFIRENQVVANELTDYGIVANRLLDIAKKLVAADINVIFNAHVKSVEAGKSKRTKFAHIRPDMPEECYTVLARKSSAIGYFEKRGYPMAPKVSCVSSNTISTKTRIREIEKTFESPNDFVTAINTYLK